jgi:hypothetical protein
MQRLAVPFALCAVWLLIAWAIDYFWFTKLCEQCSRLFGFDFRFAYREDVIKVETDRVSGIFLFALPLLIYAFVLVPYRKLTNQAAWKDAFQKWSRPFFWLAMIVFWVWLLESAFGLFEGILPDAVRRYAESYQLKISGTVLGIRSTEFNCKLGGLLGLVLGSYLFLSRGVAPKS